MSYEDILANAWETLGSCVSGIGVTDSGIPYYINSNMGDR